MTWDYLNMPRKLIGRRRWSMEVCCLFFFLLYKRRAKRQQRSEGGHGGSGEWKCARSLPSAAPSCNDIPTKSIVQQMEISLIFSFDLRLVVHS